MAGAVDETVAVAGVGNHRTRRGIDLVAGERLAAADTVLDERHGRIACGAHDLEDRPIPVGHGRSHEARPRDVGVHAVRFLGPQVDQDEVSRPNHGRSLRSGRVVRVGAVRARGHDRRMVSRESVPGEPLQNEPLHLVFRHGRRAAQIVERGVHRVADRVRGAHVTVPLRVGPDRFETLHEVRGRHDLDARFADEFQGAGVHPRHVRNRVARRILHGDAPRASEDFGKRPVVFLPREESPRGAGQVVEAVWLDGRDEPDRRAVVRNEVVPASGR